MADDDGASSALPKAQQENVLTLLCFDSEAAGVITGLVDAKLFDTVVYRRIAQQAQDYYEQYKEAPGVHISDLMEQDLERKNKNAKLTQQVLKDMHALHEEGVNKDYVLNTLKAFVRQQRMKGAVVKAANYLQASQIDEAESTILDALKERELTFEPGVSLSNTSIVDYLQRGAQEHETFDTGITALDQQGIQLARQTMLLFVSPTNRGKSWAMTFFGKKALLQRLRVLHISLEMSEYKTVVRYTQAFTAMPKGHPRDDSGKQQEIELTDIEVGDNGEFEGLSPVSLRRHPLFSEKGTEKARKWMQHRGRRLKLVVKKFPMGALTVNGLRAYMDMLERYQNFVPDVLIIDYPDLMDINAEMLRIDTGRVYRQLHGIADERNLQLIVPSQSNRSGERAKLITMEHLSEDYSKAHVADTVFTYNQVPNEKKQGLCRIHVAKERDEKSGMTALVSQGYSIGQFHRHSILMRDTDDYFRHIDHAHEPADDGDEDDGGGKPRKKRGRGKWRSKRKGR